MKDLITGAEALMRSLEHQGVTTIFGYPGGSIMPVFDALYDHQNILNHILVRHEQGAAHAAQGYARVSGDVGVCLVTSKGYKVTKILYEIEVGYGEGSQAGRICFHTKRGTDTFVSDPSFRILYRLRSVLYAMFAPA